MAIISRGGQTINPTAQQQQLNQQALSQGANALGAARQRQLYEQQLQMEQESKRMEQELKQMTALQDYATVAIDTYGERALQDPLVRRYLELTGTQTSQWTSTADQALRSQLDEQGRLMLDHAPEGTFPRLGTDETTVSMPQTMPQTMPQQEVAGPAPIPQGPVPVPQGAITHESVNPRFGGGPVEAVPLDFGKYLDRNEGNGAPLALDPGFAHTQEFRVLDELSEGKASQLLEYMERSGQPNAATDARTRMRNLYEEYKPEIERREAFSRQSPVDDFNQPMQTAPQSQSRTVDVNYVEGPGSVLENLQSRAGTIPGESTLEVASKALAEAMPLLGLSEDQYKLQNGRLHVKSGDSFIPLGEAFRSDPSRRQEQFGNLTGEQLEWFWQGAVDAASKGNPSRMVRNGQLIPWQTSVWGPNRERGTQLMEIGSVDRGQLVGASQGTNEPRGGRLFAESLERSGIPPEARASRVEEAQTALVNAPSEPTASQARVRSVLGGPIEVPADAVSQYALAVLEAYPMLFPRETMTRATLAKEQHDLNERKRSEALARPLFVSEDWSQVTPEVERFIRYQYGEGFDINRETDRLQLEMLRDEALMMGTQVAQFMAQLDMEEELEIPVTEEQVTDYFEQLGKLSTQLDEASSVGVKAALAQQYQAIAIRLAQAGHSEVLQNVPFVTPRGRIGRFLGRPEIETGPLITDGSGVDPRERDQATQFIESIR